VASPVLLPLRVIVTDSLPHVSVHLSFVLVLAGCCRKAQDSSSFDASHPKAVPTVQVIFLFSVLMPPLKLTRFELTSQEPQLDALTKLQVQSAYAI